MRARWTLRCRGPQNASQTCAPATDCNLESDCVMIRLNINGSRKSPVQPRRPRKKYLKKEKMKT